MTVIKLYIFLGCDLQWEGLNIFYRCKESRTPRQWFHKMNTSILQYIFTQKGKRVTTALGNKGMEFKLDQTCNICRIEIVYSQELSPDTLKELFENHILRGEVTYRIDLRKKSTEEVKRKAEHLNLTSDSHGAVYFDKSGRQLNCVAENNDVLDALLIEIGYEEVDRVRLNDISGPVLHDLQFTKEIQLYHSNITDIIFEDKDVVFMWNGRKQQSGCELLTQFENKVKRCSVLEGCRNARHIVFDSQGDGHVNNAYIQYIRNRTEHSKGLVCPLFTFGSDGKTITLLTLGELEPILDVVDQSITERQLDKETAYHFFKGDYSQGFLVNGTRSRKLKYSTKTNKIVCTSDLEIELEDLINQATPYRKELLHLSDFHVSFLNRFAMPLKEQVQREYHIELILEHNRCFLQGKDPQLLKEGREFFIGSLNKRFTRFSTNINEVAVLKLKAKIENVTSENNCSWKLNFTNECCNIDLSKYLGAWHDPLANIIICVQNVDNGDLVAADLVIEMTTSNLFPLSKLFIKDTPIQSNVKVGSITESMRDVIVTTVNANLNFARGQVSKMILEKAGPKMQAECKKKYPYGIAHDQIAYTKSHRMGDSGYVKYLFHGALPNYSFHDYEKTVKNFVKRCLYLADRLDCRSLVFPAIGVGNLGYPRRETAAAMFEAIEEYPKEAANCGIQEVDIMVFEGSIGIKPASTHPQSWNDQIDVCFECAGIANIDIEKLGSILLDERITEVFFFADKKDKLPFSKQVILLANLVQQLAENTKKPTYLKTCTIFVDDQVEDVVLASDEGWKWTECAEESNIAIELLGQTEECVERARISIESLLNKTKKEEFSRQEERMMGDVDNENRHLGSERVLDDQDSEGSESENETEEIEISAVINKGIIAQHEPELKEWLLSMKQKFNLNVNQKRKDVSVSGTIASVLQFESHLKTCVRDYAKSDRNVYPQTVVYMDEKSFSLLSGIGALSRYAVLPSVKGWTFDVAKGLVITCKKEHMEYVRTQVTEDLNKMKRECIVFENDEKAKEARANLENTNLTEDSAIVCRNSEITIGSFDYGILRECFDGMLPMMPNTRRIRTSDVELKFTVNDIRNESVEFIAISSSAKMTGRKGAGKLLADMLGKDFLESCEKSLKEKGDIQEYECRVIPSGLAYRRIDRVKRKEIQ
ncbi:PAR14-like protein [Mya arenaria]|uniref:PAR14-like protein n=1 Tax=Mya arenaria TaxID=6604 RepID=A0ABY7FJT2_MYAAR|nr:PAR14-like protein [Mya arenaria]